jgi:hypothetical protein
MTSRPLARPGGIATLTPRGGATYALGAGRRGPNRDAFPCPIETIHMNENHPRTTWRKTIDNVPYFPPAKFTVHSSTTTKFNQPEGFDPRIG